MTKKKTQEIRSSECSCYYMNQKKESKNILDSVCSIPRRNYFYLFICIIIIIQQPQTTFQYHIRKHKILQQLFIHHCFFFHSLIPHHYMKKKVRKHILKVFLFFSTQFKRSLDESFCDPFTSKWDESLQKLFVLHKTCFRNFLVQNLVEQSEIVNIF